MFQISFDKVQNKQKQQTLLRSLISSDEWSQWSSLV